MSADPSRLDREWVVRALSTQAYWGLWRTREQVESQIDSAWRVVGVYSDDQQVGFARAVSDGVGFAYLADVIVDEAHRWHGLGKRIVAEMIDNGPGARFRWTLFTRDAHGLYEQFGFHEPTATAMVRSEIVSG